MRTSIFLAALASPAVLAIPYQFALGNLSGLSDAGDILNNPANSAEELVEEFANVKVNKWDDNGEKDGNPVCKSHNTQLCGLDLRLRTDI
jgi:hypothetical protein